MKVLLPDGKLVDDLLIAYGTAPSHIYNAPSSADPTSLEMRKAVANEIPELRSSIMESVAYLRMLSGGGQAQS
jgi:hypothetical protein